MRKIVIVITYYKRQAQLTKTLLSINKSSHNNFEVIIINDSSEEIILPEVKFPIEIFRPENKSWIDRDIPANIGFKMALDKGADIIISQNAECYHQGDVVSYSERIKDNNYISFSAFDLDEENTFKDHEIFKLIRDNNICVTYTAQLGWYNHPEFRPIGYDFCAAISRKNMIRLNGFDERFSAGVGYGDNYWVHRVKKLGLNIEIPTEPFVVHQWHDSSWKNKITEVKQDNSVLYTELSQTDNIKAIHTLTSDFK
jgi:glycosyltransferase involved in cell wall biosynthesis